MYARDPKLGIMHNVSLSSGSTGVCHAQHPFLELKTVRATFDLMNHYGPYWRCPSYLVQREHHFSHRIRYLNARVTHSKPYLSITIKYLTYKMEQQMKD